MATNTRKDTLISSGNSSSTVLAGDAVFTGDWEEVYKFSEITILVSTSHASAADGLTFEFSTDGTNIDRKKTVSVSTSGTVHTLVVISRYFRVTYTNGSTLQTAFRLQTIYHPNKSKELTSTLDQTLTTDSDVQNVRSIIAAQKSDGTFSNVKADQVGGLNVSIGTKNLTAFGEISTAHSDPIIQELFTYNVNPRNFTLSTTNSATITQANGMAVVGTGTSTDSQANLQTRKRIQYRPGQGVDVRFTALFTAGVANTTQLAGIGDTDDGFFFGYNGATFGILHRSNASGSVVDTWVAQTSWDTDLADGSQILPVQDWTKGNVFEISYQFLGFGHIRFAVEESKTGEFITVHHIDYANENTQPSLGSPSLPICLYADNDTTTSDIVVKSASCAGFIQGESKKHGFTNSLSHNETGIGATEDNIITIQNRSTFNGKNNKNTVYPNLLVAGTIGGTKPTVLKLTLNTTLGGTPSYTNINATESIVSYDTAGTTLTGGDVLSTVVLGKEDRISLNLADIGVFLDPGDTLTISASTSSGSSEVYVSLTFREDV